jgi:type I restriction enzyme S subunit
MNKLKFKEFGEVKNGYAFKSNYFNEIGKGLPLIRIRDISKGISQTYYSGEYNEEYVVYKGDFLIGMDGDFKIFQWQGSKSLLNQRVCKIIVNKNVAEPKYIFFLLFQKLKEIQDKTPFVTVKHISSNQIKEIEFDLPPLPTQKKIVAILEKAEKLKGWRREADELTDELLKSTFLEIFGDPVKNQKGWEIVNLKTVFSNKKTGTKCGPFGSALKKYEYVNDGVPVWIMDNICENKFIKEGCLYITKEKYEQLKPYSVERGDILISRAGTVGKMCVANPSTQQSIISTNLIRLSLDSSKIEPIYFICLMTYFKGKMGRLKTGEDGAYSFMNTGILKELSIPLPPIKLQNKFIRLFEELELIQKRQTQSRQQIEDLFDALMQQAFRGELI